MSKIWVAIVAIFSAIILRVSADLYVWNNATAGNFNDARWLLDGNPANPLVCCPGINDSVLIVSDSVDNLAIDVWAPVEVAGLQVGPSSQAFILLTFNPSTKNATFTEALYVNTNTFVTMDGVDVFLPSGQEASFYPASFALLSSTDFRCIVPGNCTLIFNRAGVLGPDIFSYIRFFSIDVLFYFPSRQLRLNNYAIYQFSNSTANFFLMSIRANQGFVDFFQSQTSFRYCQLTVAANNTLKQIAYFSWWDNSYALIESTSLDGTGGEFGLRSGSIVEMDDSNDNNQLYVINLSESSLSVHDGSTLIITNYPSVRLTNRSTFFMRDNSTLKISNSVRAHYISFAIKIRSPTDNLSSHQTVVLSNALMQFWNGSFGFFDNSTISFISEAFFQVLSSSLSATRGSSILLDPSTSMAADKSQLLLDSITLGNYTALRDTVFYLRSSLVTHPDSSLIINNSTLSIEGDAQLSDSNRLNVLNASEISLFGTMSIKNAQMRTHDSTFMLRGGIETFNCTSNLDLFWLDPLLYSTTHTSCVVSFFNCQVVSNGKMNFSSNSFVAYFHSDVALNGSMLVGPDSLAFFFDSSVTVLGDVTFGENSFSLTNYSVYEFKSGTLSVGRGARIDFSAGSRASLTGASLQFMPSSEMTIINSTFSISGGDLVLDGFDSIPNEDLVNGLFVSTSLFSITGGHISARKQAAVTLRNGSQMEMSGGSILTEESGRVQLDGGSSMVLDGGNFLLNSGALVMVNSKARVRRGDIRLMNESGILVSDFSEMVVEGSIYLDGFSVLSVVKNSTLTILGGSIILTDAHSAVGVSENGAIYGVGSVNGTVLMFSGGRISFSNSSSTELYLGSLIQYNGSSFQATLSSSYANGSSTIVHVTKNTTIGGGIRITVDSSMEERLRSGERITLITSDWDIQGAFESTLIDGSDQMRCGIRVETAQRTVSVIFDINQCNTSSEVGSPVPGIVAGVVIGILVIIIIVVIVLAIKVKAFRTALMPWRDRDTKAASSSAEMIESPQQGDGSRSTWTRAVAPTTGV